MFNGIRIFFRYLFFLSRSGNEHSIHSPFIYSLYTEALKPDKRYYIFSEIEKIRARLFHDKRIISIKDYGAGSKANSSTSRKISSIARSASKSPKLCRLLFRLANYSESKTILELGTSFGISTLYLATATKDSTVVTMEGCPDTATVATENFKSIPGKNLNISIVQGNIDERLPEALSRIKTIDLVYIDANHRYEPTLRYFKEILPFTHEGTVFVLDDIYWSEEMKMAWESIKQMEEVTVTVDLFHVGLVFFRKAQPKQHFLLRI